MSEQSTVTGPTIAALNAIPGVLCFRIHSGKKNLGGRWIHLGEKGMPDLGLVIRGRAIFLEAKTDTGKLSVDQELMHDRLRRCGACVFTIRSVAEALGIARAALGESHG